MEWMLLPYKRYAEFSGRSRRKEYWMFTLFYAAVFLVLMFAALFSSFPIPEDAPQEIGTTGTILFALLAIFALGSFIPALAVQIRRFHDQDKSGWYFLLNFIPYIGGFVVLVFMCFEGTRGENSYGPDPKGWNNAGTFD